MLTGSLPAVTNRETWKLTFELYDADVGPTELIDLTDTVVTVSVADENGCPVLTGSSTGSNVTLTNPGIVEIKFDKTQMGAICARTYGVGVLVTKNDETFELFLGSLPILEGINRQ